MYVQIQLILVLFSFAKLNTTFPANNLYYIKTFQICMRFPF